MPVDSFGVCHTGRQLCNTDRHSIPEARYFCHMQGLGVPDWDLLQQDTGTDLCHLLVRQFRISSLLVQGLLWFEPGSVTESHR